MVVTVLTVSRREATLSDMSAEYYECFRFGVRQILFNLAYFRVCASLFLGRGLMVTYC